MSFAFDFKMGKYGLHSVSGKLQGYGNTPVPRQGRRRSLTEEH